MNTPLKLPKLAGQNIVVFDLEIKNTINQNGVTWDTYDRMGISVGCLFDFRTNDYLCFMDDNLSALAERINGADLVVGFNISDFDLPLLAATDANKIALRGDLPVYDILYHSRNSFNPYDKYKKGMKLDNHLKGTFGVNEMKTANGAEAPLMWQNKEIGKLVSYCLADVKKESKLFQYVWNTGKISTDTYGERPIERPKLYHDAIATLSQSECGTHATG